MTGTTESWFLDRECREEWPDGEEVRDVVLDVITDALYVVDRRGRFVDWNERFCEQTGYTDAEVDALHQFAIIPDEVEDEARALLAQVADGEEVALQAPLLTKDGEQIPHEFSAAPLTDEDGEVWGMVGTARDISELVTTRDRLRQREQQFSTLVSNFPGMVYRARSKHGCAMEFVSEGAVELSGYDPATLESGELSWREEIIHPEDRADAVAAVQRALDREETFTITYRIVTRDGTVRWVEDNGRCVERDGEGVVPEGFITDITDRKERERRLERYERLIETVGDGVYILDDERCFVQVNDPLVEMLGYDREELLGKPVSAVVSESDAERGLSLRERLKESDETVATIEGELVRNDGTQVPVEGRFSLLDEPGFSTIGLVRDISDRKEREQRLTQYKQLIDAVGDGVVVVDETGHVQRCNASLADILGYDRDEIEGMHLSKFTVAGIEEVSRDLRDELANTDTTVVSAEGEAVRKDGSTVPVEGRYSFLSTRPDTTIGLVRDITERRKRLELFQRLHDGMQQLMATETVPEVAATAASVVQDHFESASTGVRLLRDGQLEMVAFETNGVSFDERVPRFEVGEGFVGEAYERGEPVIYEDLTAVETPIDYGPIRAVMLLPIPGYGMISVAMPEPGAFDETDMELGRLFVADVQAAFERTEREQQLRDRKHELEQYETLVETMGDGVYMTDADNRLTMVNDSLAEMFGRSRESMLGEIVGSFGDETREDIEAARRALLAGERDIGQMEDVIERPDGTTIHVENRFSLLPAADEFRGTVGVVRDVTDRKEREDLLRNIHEVSRSLLTAETRQEVAARTAAAAERLGFSTIGVRLLDETGEKLDVVAQDSDAGQMEGLDFPSYSVGEGFIGEIYERGEAVIYDDLREHDMGYDPSPVTSALFLPIEGHGMISIGGTETGAFTETDLELGRVFAADFESALERADREERLKTQRDELETLNRLNELVQETIGALATAPTREEIETTVVERLAESSLYRFAVTGTQQPGEMKLEYTTWAGEGADYLDAVEVLTDAWVEDAGPAAEAIETGAVRVTQNVATDPAFAPFREPALEHGFQSVAAVPFTYNGVVHGLLGVYADRADAFSEREIQAFEVLGEMVGFAISATQNRRLIESDSHLELTFEITDASGLFPDLCADMGVTCRLVGSAETSDDGMLHYVSVTGADPDAVLERVTGDIAAPEEARLIRADDDEALLEVRLTASVPSLLLNSGFRPLDVVPEAGTVRIVAEAPRDSDIRAVTERLESHGNVSLVSKREVENWQDPADSVREQLDDALTDRQRSVLNAAYFGGYFDWPRDSTAEEIAASLDISSATLHQHLRHAQRKLLTAYLAVDSGDTR